MQLKIAIIVSEFKNIDFIKDIIKSLLLLNNSKVIFILLDLNIELEKYLKFQKIEFYNINYSNRTYFKCLLELIFLLVKNKIDVVHCHLWNAVKLGIPASFIARIKKRIYSRHHGQIYDSNLVKFTYENFLETISTDIIVYSKNNLDQILKNNFFNKHKFNLIQYGFDENIGFKMSHKIKNYLRLKYKLNQNNFLVGSISRMVKWKGLQNTLKAFHQFLKYDPHAILLIANSHGPYELELNNILKKIPKKNIRLVKFERNIYELIDLFDIFIHVPINKDAEAFGQVYIQSLLMKKKTIFTLSGVGTQFLRNNQNCFLVKHNNYLDILKTLIFCKNNKKKLSHVKNNGMLYVKSNFTKKKFYNEFSIAHF